MSVGHFPTFIVIDEVDVWLRDLEAEMQNDPEEWDSLTSEERAYRIHNHFEGEVRLDPETGLIKGYKLA